MAEWGVARAENAQLQETNNPEIPHRPDGIQVDGQTFAATVLFALSCSPLLRAHLLQSLSATSEELDSLEPFLSAAWDQWYQVILLQRRIRHTEQVAQARLQEHGVQQQLMRILSITNEELCSFEPVLSAAWDQRDRAVSIVQRLSMFFGDLMAADNTLFVMTPGFVMSNEQVVQARRQEQQPSVDGQTFAATLLLSLSCSPLLKAHLLQGLGATNEELESSEDALSAAWDQWDRVCNSADFIMNKLKSSGKCRSRNRMKISNSNNHRRTTIRPSVMLSYRTPHVNRARSKCCVVHV